MYCRSCAENKRSAWRKAHPDRARAQAAKYREANRDKVNRATQKWRDKNPNHRIRAAENRRANPEKALLSSAKDRARRKKIPFNIDKSDIIIPKICPYLGILLEPSRGAMTDTSPTLDRIDNTKGYIKGNILVVSWRANRLKADATPEELKRIANYLSNIK